MPALIAAAVAVITMKDLDMYIDEKTCDNIYAVTGYNITMNNFVKPSHTVLRYAIMYQLLFAFTNVECSVKIHIYFPCRCGDHSSWSWYHHRVHDDSNSLSEHRKNQ